MAEQIPPDAYRQLLVNATPLIDLRAPIEFNRGAFPAAVNLPLLQDDEREAIGKRYKQAGQDAAVALGMDLVSGAARDRRLQGWIDFAKKNPGTLLYCFRGGQRSRIAQQWLADAGCQVPRIAGGYKALRRFLIEALERAAGSCQCMLVGGRTGSNKTGLLQQLPNSVDLEGHAHHRGSAFGRRSQPQPAQIDFENRLAIALLSLPFEGFRRLILEDESRAIGSLSIPLPFYRAMSSAPVAVIEEPMGRRVETVRRHYIDANFREFLAQDPATAEERFRDYLGTSLHRIRRRLQQVGLEELQQNMNDALRSHFLNNEPQAHDVWIEKLLRYYYDPMYDYQLDKKSQRIVFRGSGAEFLRWASNLNSTV